MAYIWQKDTTGAHLLNHDSDHIATLLPSQAETVCYQDEITEVQDGVFRCVRRFRLTGDAPVATVRLTLEVVAEHSCRYALIPGVSYNGNAWGTGHEPKGLTHEAIPWTFAAHRTALAGGTYSEGDRWSVALFGSAIIAETAFACSLMPGDGHMVHRLIWPEEEGPRVYNSRDSYGPAHAAVLTLRSDEEFVAEAYLVVEPITVPRVAWRKALDVAWQRDHRPATPRFSPEGLWKLGIRYAKESLWADDGVFHGFSIGLESWEGLWRQRQYMSYEIGWCGQNASLAASLLSDYLRSGDESSRDMGLAALDCWVSHARLPNGLVRCRFDAVLGRSPGALNAGCGHSDDTVNELQDAANLGGAATALFEAAELAVLCGAADRTYGAVALGICDFAVRTQLETGQIGRTWRNDGSCSDREGTIGCFLVPPLVKAFEVTGMAHYLTAAEKGYAYYMARLLSDGYSTAGALDTHCIDKESASPLLDAGLALYAVTRNTLYLDWAAHAAYYLASWQWHHTVPNQQGSALGELDYDTLGGTSVSAQHHHQDPYGVAFVPGWLRLAELTGQGIWRQRACAAWANASIGVSDGELVVLGKRRPAGSQDEAAYHTHWGNYGGVSEWLVAWPTAFRLAVLRSLPDWSILA
ncbi:MAG: hypothetical protein JWO59_2122 [Chloroflexi bacterium]|nr:hypothetical protein [Chloroflexota bacterium]